MKNINLICLFSLIVTLAACGGEGNMYALRSTGPAGGLIFYVDPSEAKLLPQGTTYMEAALIDQPTGLSWYNGGYVAEAATETAIGTGQTNTTAIVAIQGDGNYAAKACDDLVSGGRDDWFLPSKDELDKMYVNLQKGTDEHGVTYTPVGTFGGSEYWSSSESSEYEIYQAWGQSFVAGNTPSEYYKYNEYYVRCVRTF